MMSGAGLPCVTVELGTLRRLIAAARLDGCATWAEAVRKAEDDVRPWAAQIPADQHTVEVSTRVLAKIAEAAESVADAHADDGAPWTRLVDADLAEVAALCRTPLRWRRPDGANRDARFG